MAKWTTAYKDRLPDTAFAAWRTMRQRSLPVFNHQGRISLHHVNNALARVNQVIDDRTGKRISSAKQAKIRKYLQGLKRKYYKQHPGYVAPAMKRRYAKEAREAKMKRRAIKMRKGVGKKRNPPRKKPLRWATAEWRVYKYRVLGARGAVYETTTLKEAKKMAGKNGQIIEYFKPK